MSLQQFMKNMQIVSCSPNTKVSECAKLMRDKDVGSIIITDGQKLAGMVTDRDLVVRGIADGAEAAEKEVREFMSSPVATVPHDSGIHDIVSLMKEKSVRRIVICDDSGKPQGIVSHGDVIKLLATEMNEIAEGTCPEHDKLKGEGKVAS